MSDYESRIGRTPSCRLSDGDLSWTDTIIKHLGLSPGMGFICLASLFSQTGYVDAKLADLPKDKRASIASKILYELLPSEDFPSRFRVPPLRPEIILVLLEHGADPNYGEGMTTTWRNVLRRPSDSRSSPPIQSNFVHIMGLLVKAGASKDATIIKRGGHMVGEQVVKKYVLPRFQLGGTKLLIEMSLQNTTEKMKECGCVTDNQGSSVDASPHSQDTTTEESNGDTTKNGEVKLASWDYKLVLSIRGWG